MEWMFLPLRRYADFAGRSRRKEYWMFVLLTMIVSALLFVPLFALMPPTGYQPSGDYGPSVGAGIGSLLYFVFAIVIIVPAVAVQVRRFHDLDKSGWMVLLNFVPLIGGLIVLVFMCMEGTPGANRYGPDPKAAVPA